MHKVYTERTLKDPSNLFESSGAALEYLRRPGTPEDTLVFTHSLWAGNDLIALDIKEKVF